MSGHTAFVSRLQDILADFSGDPQAAASQIEERILSENPNSRVDHFARAFFGIILARPTKFDIKPPY
jgi:hypothetical protein